MVLVLAIAGVAGFWDAPVLTWVRDFDLDHQIGFENMLIIELDFFHFNHWIIRRTDPRDCPASRRDNQACPGMWRLQFFCFFFNLFRVFQKQLCVRGCVMRRRFFMNWYYPSCFKRYLKDIYKILKWYYPPWFPQNSAHRTPPSWARPRWPWCRCHQSQHPSLDTSTCLDINAFSIWYLCLD